MYTSRWPSKSSGNTSCLQPVHHFMMTRMPSLDEISALLEDFIKILYRYSSYLSTSSMFYIPMAAVYLALPLCFPFVAIVISLGLVASLFHLNCSCAVGFSLLFPVISRISSTAFLFSSPLFAILSFYSCICIFMTAPKCQSCVSMRACYLFST